MEELAPSPVSAQPSIHQAYGQLRQAIEHDDGATVKQLLQQFVAIFPNLLRWQDRTMRMPPLVTLAAKNGAVRVLEVLLEHPGSREPFPIHRGEGAKPFQTPLNAACQAVQMGAVRYLLDLNPPWDIEEKDDDGNTPLLSALQAESKQAEQSEKIIHWLLTAGADATAVTTLLDKRDVRSIWNNLKLAMRSAGPRVIKWLVEAGAKLDAEEMKTLLRVGCQHHNALGVETLLQLGGKSHLSAPDMDGRLPLHVAVDWWTLETQTTFYSNHQTRASEIRAAMSSIHETLNVLLSHDEVRRATINATDKMGATPLPLAACIDYVPILHQLLDHGADPLIHGSRGASLLHPLLSSAIDIRRGPFRPDEYENDIDEDLLRRLISPPTPRDAHANAAETTNPNPNLDLINEPDPNSGETPLHLAARGWLERTIGILLRLGANPNARDTVGRSPAHLAAELRYIRENEDSAAALAKQDWVLRLLTTALQVNDVADLDNAVAGGTVRSVLDRERATLWRRREWFVKVEALREGARRELARIAQLPAEMQPAARRGSAWYGVGPGWDQWYNWRSDPLTIVADFVRQHKDGLERRARGWGRGAASRFSDEEVEESMRRLDRLLERQA